VKNVLELIDQLGCLFAEDPGYDFAKHKPEEKENLKKILTLVEPTLGQSDFF